MTFSIEELSLAGLLVLGHLDELHFEPDWNVIPTDEIRITIGVVFFYCDLTEDTSDHGFEIQFFVDAEDSAVSVHVISVDERFPFA